MIKENKNKDTEKRFWTKPEIYIIDFKETMGGEYPGEEEDADYDTHYDSTAA